MPEMLPNRHEFRRLPWVFRYYLYIMATALLIAGVVVVGRLLVTFEPLHIGGYSIVPPVVCPSDPIRTTVSVSVDTHHKHRALSDPVPEHRPHLPAHKAHDKA